MFIRDLFLKGNKFFTAKDSSLNLAMFRIVVFSTLIISSFNIDYIWFYNIPEELRIAEPAVRWIKECIPYTHQLIVIFIIIFKISTIFALLGLFTNISIGVSIVSGFYLIALTHIFGKIQHAHHHLFMFQLLLLMSKCGDSLSLDCIIDDYRKTKTINLIKDTTSVLYALPIRFVWILIGLIYFYAGIWKLLGSKHYWLTDTPFFQHILYSYWFTWFVGNNIPILRIDHYPILLRCLPFLIVMFQLLFIFLIFSDNLRKYAIICGIFFHNLTLVFLHISFWTLQCCYLSFINFGSLIKNVVKPSPVNTVKKSIVPIVLTGVTLILIQSYVGFREIKSWPFSAYPNFSNKDLQYRFINFKQFRKKTLIIKAFNVDGKEIDINTRIIKKKIEPGRWEYILNYVANSKSKAEQIKLCNAISKLLFNNIPDIREASYIVFYEGLFSTIPEEYNNNPINLKTIISLKID
ncbi:MAG: hypothetical protein HYR97_05230 [Candidatus Melainabacteria bacterium]|nr:hypothetical protein [Candidatus Melainabacteria bacterium]